MERATEAADGRRESTHLEVAGGSFRVLPGPTGSCRAELSWPRDQVHVWEDGRQLETASCHVDGRGQVRAEAVQSPAQTRYVVTISRDRMEAVLRVVLVPGCRRTLVDDAASTVLRLRVSEARIEPDAPDSATAQAELQRAGVTFGIDADHVARALAHPGEDVVVALGADPVEGRHGYLEHLVDFEELRRTGVPAGTPLVRRVHRRDGVPGRDVTGRTLAVPATRDEQMRAGEGVSIDEHGTMAIAAVDGMPFLGADGRVEVRHELVLDTVDATTGDVQFHGSVRVLGDVREGRRVIARDELLVEGAVDRGHLESGGSMCIRGSVMSSTLRAGGERAVAATIADRVLELPRQLAIVATHARQMRDVAEARGIDVSFGLATKLVLEQTQRAVLPAITSIRQDLADAGPAHADDAERAAAWHRRLSTAANTSLTPEEYQELLGEVAELADGVRRATEQAADLVVSYLQSCVVEATGTVTLVGKGIFSSRVVAWGGLVSDQHEAVLRGGSIVSHGRVHVREVGSPAGTKTVVQLGAGAELEADRAYAGTTISGPGYTHRFVADRSCVRISFDSGGSMNVESLAA